MAARIATALLLLLALSDAEGAAPQDPPAAVPEYRVKAAFLYNFIVYTEWPAKAFSGADAPIRVGVIGKDPFGTELDAAFKGKLVNGRAIQARRAERLDDLGDCHLLFIPRAEAGHAREILANLKGRAVLVVGESDAFAERGGAIGFVEENRKLRFEVNAAAVARAGLKLSSKLLNLARIVKERDE